MRILYITDGFPFPLTSGYLRHYHLLKGLSKSYEIVLVSVVGRSFKEEHAAALAPFTQDIITVLQGSRGSRSLSQRIIKRTRTLFGVNPAIRELRETIQRLLSEQKFDLVLLSGEYTFTALKNLETPPILTDMCDAISNRIRGWIDHANLLRKLTLWVKYWELTHIEQATIRRSKQVLFASERDRSIVPETALSDAIILPNGVDLDYWQRKSDTLQPNTIIFTGAMHYPPNRDAALFLINDILPLVRQTVPDAELYIAGHSPPTELVEAGKTEGVHVTGFVDDMREYLEKATVFASPLRFGSGIQNKVLEAMAMQLPIITTSIAADGLITPNGDKAPVILAETATEFSQNIIQQFQQRSADPKPDMLVREYVQEHFSWEYNTDKLDKIIKQIVNTEAGD
jgi:glycosyltransferase involved in cell wall biosynthesis